VRRVFIVLYAASGAAALIYEVTWTRLLTLQMGHTVAAASTVLAAFMGGLALGAWIAGRARGGLRAYATLELVIALAALALPALLAAGVPALAWAYADGTTPTRFAVVRLALSLTLVLAPASAMGATFPIAARWFAQVRLNPDTTSAHTVRLKADTTPISARTASAAADVGALYSANTAGAAAGAVAAGFWLIPAIGVRGTTFTGVALNLFAAAGALWLSRLVTTINAETAELAENEKTNKKKKASALRAQRVLRLPSSEPQPGLAWSAAAVSGFVALVYEVAWTRLLALVIGPTTYAFATMVASFVGGLAIGSAAGARIARRSAHPAVWLAAILVMTAGAATGAAWYAASRLPLIVAAQVADPNAAFGPVILQQAFVVAVLLLPMTFALGAAFPLALATASAGVDTVGRDTARVYAFNTLGAIAGALAAGFVLLPAVGLQATFRAAAMIGLIAGAGTWVVATVRLKPDATATVRLKPDTTTAAAGIVAGAIVAAGIFAWPQWDRALVASGAYKYAPYMGAGDLEMTLRAGRLEYYKEGAAATVSVRRLAGTRSLAIDGKVDASDGGDMLTQQLLGLLPTLLHREPQEICVIGLGSGVTLNAALSSGTVRRADIVEISPEVVDASAFFEHENDNALRARGVRLIVGDGRSHLLLTKQKYDVIVSEPSNPWMAGVAALFTREFFEAARARLQPDGLLCQWAHTYDISDRDLRSIVATFASVFPQGTMWLIGESDLLLIGTNGAAIEPHLDTVVPHSQRGRAGAFLGQLTAPIRTGTRASASFGAPLFELFSLYAGGPRELGEYSASALIQTDDRMALEFSAPQGIYGRTTNHNAATIRALLADDSRRPAAVREAMQHATDVSWAARGSMELKAEAYAIAYDDFRRAVTLNSQNAGALSGLSEAAAGAGLQNEERAWLQSLAVSQPSNAVVRVELSRLQAASGDFPGAIATATDALRLAPDDPRTAEQLASIYADAGDVDRLRPLADALVSRFPNRSDLLYYRATALFMSGQAAEAVDEARRVVARDPYNARALNLLGAACGTSGQTDCARTAFEASLAANARDPVTYVNLGLFHLQAGDPARAAGYFAEALTLDPASTGAREGLAQARAKP
jgi:spermidine synthase